MSLKHFAMALGALFLWLWGTCPPCQADSVDLTAKISGVHNPPKIKFQGTMAFMPLDGRLNTLDVSDPDHPCVINQLEIDPAITDFDTTGTTLLYLTGNSIPTFIHIIDISNPASPKFAGFVQLPQYINSHGVSYYKIRALSAKQAIVTSDDQFFLVSLDPLPLRPPFTPTSLTTFALPNSELAKRTMDFTLLGKYVITTQNTYPAAGIWELNGVTTPTLKGTWNSNFASCQVIANGSQVYVSDHTSGFYAVDITDPATPVRIGKALKINAKNIALSGNRALILDNSCTLNVIDISDPTSPTTKVAFSGNLLPYLCTGGGSGGNLACLADSKGYQLIDLTTPTQPVRRGRYNMFLGYFGALAMQGSLACVLNSNTYYNVTSQTLSERPELIIFDLTSTTNPALKSRIPLEAPPWSLTLSGEQAIMLSNYQSNELRIYDLNNPTSPTLKSITPLNHKSYSSQQNRFAVAGPYLYMADDSTTLSILNISRPEAPVLQSTFTLPERSRQIVMQGNRADILSYNGATVYRYDLVDPLNPRLVGSFNARSLAYPYHGPLMLIPGLNGPGNAIGIQGSLRYRFTTLNYLGLENALPLGSVQEDYQCGIGVTPAIYYMIGDTFDVIDASHAQAPFIRARFDMHQGWDTYNLAADGSHALVGDIYTLWFLNYTGPLGESAAGVDWRSFE